jgi:hypothetical protein
MIIIMNCNTFTSVSHQIKSKSTIRLHDRSAQHPHTNRLVDLTLLLDYRVTLPPRAFNINNPRLPV